MKQLDTILEKLPDARQEADGSIVFECPICRVEGHANKQAKLYVNGALSCTRFASAGKDANRTHCEPLRQMLGLGALPAAFVTASLFTGARQVNLEVEPINKSMQFLTARNCKDVLHSAELRLGKPDERAAFVAALPDLDGDERAMVAHELVQLFDRYRKARAATDDDGDAAAFEAQSAATRLITLTDDIQLIHDANGDGYAVMMVEGHKETWPLRSKGFKRWLQRRFYEQYEKAPGSQAVQDALGVIEGKALYDSPERKLFIRIAEKAGKIYLDLADDRWRAVEIDADDWRVVDIPPVEFRRAKGMLPLPVPIAGGSLEELRPFLNLEKGDLWTLILGSLVMKLHPRGPYNLDVFTGGQGCGKTTRARVIRALVDPSSADTRSAPREIRDLHIAAVNEWLPTFDNISSLPPWLSDGLCCLSTGGGSRTRELYSDNEEAIFSAKRPIILTSITEVVQQPDLLDRSIIYDLPQFEPGARKPEKQLWAEFKAAHASILGALLDAAVCALCNEDKVVINEASRMADFERWAIAAEPKLGLKTGAFRLAYAGNRGGANDLALDSCSIAEPVINLAELKAVEPDEVNRFWIGTATELFDLLLTGKSDEEKRKLKEQGWPKAPNGFAAMLRRLAPNLLVRGVKVEFNIRFGKNGSRKIRITKINNQLPTEPQPTTDDEKNSDPAQQDLVGKTSSAIVRSSASVEDKGLSLAEADDLLTMADDVTDDLFSTEAYSEELDTEEFASSADDLTMADDVLQGKSCSSAFIALDTETQEFDERAGLTPRTVRMLGMSLCYDGERADYVTDPAAWSLMMPEPEQIVAMHNAKFDLLKLQQVGLPLPTQWEDTMIAAHLLDETGEHGLKELAQAVLKVPKPVTYKEAARERLLNPEAFNEYARNDARYTWRLWDRFKPELERQELMPVYELEKAVVPVAMAMEDAGMLVDVEALKRADVETKSRLAQLESEIFDQAGCRFKLQSPAKLAVILTDKLGLALPKTTDSGQPCVDKHSLKDLAGQHPIIPPLLEYRELDKLASGFISPLPGLTDERGRVHPTFNQLGATSGRFTCSKPNVQQMPRSSGLAKLLRAAFIAEPGHLLVCADWSQIELRVLAHFSKDPALVEAFLSGADLHTRTAALMFGKSGTEVTKTERTIAKSINFGIAYGMGAPGLFKSLHAAGQAVTMEECSAFIGTYHRSYPGVRRFLDAVGRNARKHGYATTLLGRRRRLSADGSNELSVKNAVIQGTAADIAKAAMVKLHTALPEGARLIATVHDEFIVECRADQADDVCALMVETMQLAPDGFTVPMIVEAKIGASWGEGKDAGQPSLNAAPVARVAFMITNRMRQQLYNQGFNQAAVDAMEPAEAQAILSNGAGTAGEQRL